MASLPDRSFGFATRALHAGQRPDAETGARAVPIYQTTSYVFDDTAHAAALFNLQRFGNIYTRIMNPTTAVFEERMASLERGVGALAVGSGQAAQFIALASLVEAGDEIVAAKTLYGGTYTQLDVSFRRLGVATTFVDPGDPENFRRAITPRTRVLYGETIGNPGMNVLDIAAVAAVAHDNNLPLMVDNTFASPYLCRPIEHGADIVVHSATKFIGGHGTSIGGVIVDSGRFPLGIGALSAVDRAQQGLSRHPLLRDLRRFRLHHEGAGGGAARFRPGAQPLQLFPLPARAGDAQAAHAVPLAERAGGGAIPGSARARGVGELPRHWPAVASHALAGRYLPRGAGGILTFGIKGGLDAGRRFIEALQLVSHLANVGDAKSLVIHPASTTHQQLTTEEKLSGGITDDLIRLSVGLEETDDILWDLDQALKASA